MSPINPILEEGLVQNHQKTSLFEVPLGFRFTCFAIKKSNSDKNIQKHLQDGTLISYQWGYNPSKWLEKKGFH